jgi:hypothetical protein
MAHFSSACARFETVLLPNSIQELAEILVSKSGGGCFPLDAIEEPPQGFVNTSDKKRATIREECIPQAQPAPLVRRCISGFRRFLIPDPYFQIENCNAPRRSCAR